MGLNRFNLLGSWRGASSAPSRYWGLSLLHYFPGIRNWGEAGKGSVVVLKYPGPQEVMERDWELGVRALEKVTKEPGGDLLD